MITKDIPALGKLSGVVQNYNWGVQSPEGNVAKYSRTLESGKPCAELWFGGHKRAESTIFLASTNSEKSIALSKVLSKELSFLVKFLSVDPSFGLSIQLHPTEEQAKKLHLLDLEKFPDANSKPELAVALTEVELLHGIKPGAEESLRCTLQLESSQIREKVLELVRKKSGSNSSEDICFLRLLNQYGAEDRGLLLFDNLNFVTLKPGQAVFTAPGRLHAYLKGEILEVLANSDNVVRAGLTRKDCSVELLLELTDFTATTSKLVEVKKHAVSEEFLLETDKFSVSRILNFTGNMIFQQCSRDRMLVCTAGVVEVSAQDSSGIFKVRLKEGEVCFLGAGVGDLWGRFWRGEVYIVG